MKTNSRRMSLISLTVILAAIALTGHGQQAVLPPACNAANESVLLWPAGTPHAVGNTAEDIPCLIPFLPVRARTSTAILVIPGGGYAHLSLPTEGVEIAHFLNAAGIPAFVLDYRLGPRYRYPAQIDDAQRAMRYLRAHAEQYKIQMVGAMGFSAGGHLAAMLGTNFSPGDPQAADPVDRFDSRPDFLVLGYPVIDDLGGAADGSLRNIDPDTSDLIVKVRPGIPAPPPISEASLKLLSVDLHVNAKTPPTFLVCADDDPSVSPEDSVRFYLALLHADVPAELHIYAHGRHGFGLAAWDPIDSQWTAQMLEWLRASGDLPPLPASTKQGEIVLHSTSR
jgi:acetyl esterase/lipase